MKLVYVLLLMLSNPCLAADVIFAGNGNFDKSGKNGICVETKTERNVVFFSVDQGKIWSRNTSLGSGDGDAVARAVFCGEFIFTVSFGGTLNKLNRDGVSLAARKDFIKQTAVDLWTFDDEYLYVKTAEWDIPSRKFLHFIYKISVKSDFKIEARKEIEIDSIIFQTKEGVFAASPRKTIKI